MRAQVEHFNILNIFIIYFTIPYLLDLDLLHLDYFAYHEALFQIYFLNISL